MAQPQRTAKSGPTPLAANKCVVCQSKVQTKDNPITTRLYDSKPKHVLCRFIEEKGG